MASRSRRIAGGIVLGLLIIVAPLLNMIGIGRTLEWSDTCRAGFAKSNVVPSFPRPGLDCRGTTADGTPTTEFIPIATELLFWIGIAILVILLARVILRRR